MASQTEINIAGGYTPFTLKRARHLDVFGQALNKLDTAFREADDRKSAVAQAFAQARELLPDNEETNQYITDNQNNVIDSINEAVRRGNPFEAIRTSKNMASAFMSSPEFVARTKEHKQRTAWLEDLDKAGVDQYIKDYYRDTYSDRNNFTRDANGNVTGTAGFRAPIPEQGQSATSIIEQALKTTRDERLDQSSEWNSNASDGSGSGHNTRRRETLTANKISETAMSIVNNNPRIRQAFVDQFNAGIHQITKLETQLRNESDPARRAELENQIAGYKSSFYKNEAPISSADEYIRGMFSSDNMEIKNAAYDYVHTNTGSGSKTATATNGNVSGVSSQDIEEADDRGNAAPRRKPSTGGATLPARGNRPSSYVAPGNTWSRK